MISWLTRKIKSSISTKAALIVITPIVVIMVFHAYNEYRHDRALLFRMTETELLRVAEGLIDPVEMFVSKRDRTSLESLVRDAGKGASIDLVTVFDPQENVAASSVGKWMGKSLTEMHPQEVSTNDVAALRKSLKGGYSVYFDEQDNRCCLAVPINYGSGENGALLVSFAMGDLRLQVAAEALKDFSILVVLIGVIGTSIYFFFYYFFIRRIQVIAHASLKLARGDTSSRAEDAGADEIGYLATSFNLLAEDITNWRSNLEGMVDDRLKELSTLFEIAHMIGQSFDLSLTMPRVLRHILNSLGEQKGVIVLIGEDGVSLTLLAHQGLSPDALNKIAGLGQGCAGDVILKKNALRISSPGQDLPGLENENVRSVLAVPISGRGLMLGAMIVYSGKANRFSEQDETLLITIGNQSAVAVENARLYEKTLAMAREDGLTGLANRRFLMERLKREVNTSTRYHTALSALMIDLDKFKSFNDTYGHGKGDELLKKFAALLKKNIRQTDFTGRYGGEEFAVILPNTAVKGAIVIAERIRRAAEEMKISLDDGGQTARRTVSIGVAELTSGETEEQLLGNADAALYRAKQDGRNRVAV